LLGCYIDSIVYLDGWRGYAG